MWTVEVFAELLWDVIDSDVIRMYLTGDSGDRLGVYADGQVIVGDSVGNEIDEDERPIVWVQCPGIGNIDMTYYRTDLVGEALMSDEEVIASCCEHGDVTNEIQDLRDRLITQLRDN